MKRYYLCDVIGDGSEENSYRPALADYGVNHVAVIPTGPNGRPLFAWCLALVDTPGHGALLADVRLDALPDFPPDAKISSMHRPTKQAMTNAIQRRGVGTSFIEGADGYREIIRSIGRYLDTNFDENNFDVSE